MATTDTTETNTTGADTQSEPMSPAKAAAAKKGKGKTAARGRPKGKSAAGKKKAFVSAKPKPAKLVSAIDKPKRHRKKNYERFDRFIYKVLKTTARDMRISKRGMTTMNGFTLDMSDRISRLAGDLAFKRGTRTMSANDVETAVKMILPSELGQLAVAEGKRACMQYAKSMNAGKEPAPKKPRASSKGKAKAE